MEVPKHSPKSTNKPISKQRQCLIEEFENEWKEEEQEIEEMIGSQLLDSLDLDFGTLARGQNYNKQIKKNPIK